MDRRLSPYVELVVSVIAASALQLVFLRSLSIIFPIYFVTLIPFFSVLAAFSLVLFVADRSRRAVMMLVAALTLINAFVYKRDLSMAATLDNLEEIASDVQALTDEGDTLFGSYAIAPLIALSADRGITDNQIETNLLRNLTGLFPSDAATRVATKSAIFLQEALVDPETGRILRLRPSYVDESILRDACTLLRGYPLERSADFTVLFLWDCSQQE
ncbi:hypothetical protein IH980_01785 [Patescibacteria group bacterium]|nr:hypothetical protein [Patescibacteria group bacterium]